MLHAFGVSGCIGGVGDGRFWLRGGAISLVEEALLQFSQLPRKPNNSLGHEESDKDEQAAKDIRPLLSKGVSGIALSALQPIAPRIGPRRLLRPPTAHQTTASRDLS